MYVIFSWSCIHFSGYKIRISYFLIEIKPTSSYVNNYNFWVSKLRNNQLIQKTDVNTKM